MSNEVGGLPTPPPLNTLNSQKGAKNQKILKERQGGALTDPNKNYKINKQNKKINDVAFVAEEDEIEFEIRLLELEHTLVELLMEIQRNKTPLPFLEDETEMEPEIELGKIDKVDINEILQTLNTRGDESISDSDETDSDSDEEEEHRISNSPPAREDINNKLEVNELNLAIMNVNGLKTKFMSVSNIVNTFDIRTLVCQKPTMPGRRCHTSMTI